VGYALLQVKTTVILHEIKPSPALVRRCVGGSDLLAGIYQHDDSHDA
jgi:hypothetical protein